MTKEYFERLKKAYDKMHEHLKRKSKEKLDYWLKEKEGRLH